MSPPTTLYTTEQFRAQRDDRWEEIDFLLRQGESPRRVAQRLNISAEALSRQAYRAFEVEQTDVWLERARRFNYSRKTR